MKKYITFIVFLMFLTIAVFPNGESAGLTLTIDDWESYNIGVTSGTGTYGTWEVDEPDSDSVVTSNGCRSGKCLCIKGFPAIFYYNLTTEFEYVSKISIWIKNIMANGWVKFYNDTLEVAYIKHVAGKWKFYDATSTWVDIGTCADSEAGWLNITHVSCNLMNYSWYDSADGSTIYQEGASKVSYTWTTFDSIKITNNVGTWDCRIDDIIISTKKEISDDTCEYRYATERYAHIGNVNTYCSRQSNKKTIETRYNVPVDLDIKCIDLAVDIDQYIDDDDKSNYILTINGLPVSSPACFFEYSYYYILRWYVDIDLDNETIVLEFTHSKKTSFGRYWQVMTGCYSGTDMDNDGEIGYSETNTPDGAYNGYIWNWDIAYQIYYENIHFPDDETYYNNDYISVINETHYCGEPVWLTYTLTSMASDTYIRVWNDDTTLEVDDVMFPYKCPSTTETVGFIAETKANYTAKLYRNSVVLDTVSFFVEDFRNPTNYVYTMPNPCFEGEPYTVKYAYDNLDSYDGAIFLSGSPDYKNYYDVYYLLDGDSGSYVQMQNAPCTIYYILAVNKNDTYYVVDNGIHQHTVKSKSLQNYFTLGATHVTLASGEGMQSVNGETTHIGGNCKIYDNEKLVYTISETPFNEFYKITTAGNHKVEMRLITNETIVLYTQSYTVSGEEEALPPEEDIGEVIRNYIKQTWGELGLMVFAFGIIIGLMLIPLYVQLKASQSNTSIEVPWLAYVLFAVIGIILDVYLGFLPLYTILLLCIVAIAVTVSMYFGNKP